MRDFGVGRRVYSPRSPASTRVYFEYHAQDVADCDRAHRLCRREGLDDTIALTVRSVTGGIRRAIEADDRRTERRREVQRPCIAADDEPGSAEERGQLAKVRRRRNRSADRMGKRLLTWSPGDEDVAAEPSGQLRKAFDRPLLLRSSGSWQQDDAVAESLEFARWIGGKG